MTLDAAAEGLEEQASLIYFHLGAWQDFGYTSPPSPECKTVPPLGERSAEAITAAYEAVKGIDQLTAQLHKIRAQLAAEMREDQDKRGARVDAMLAEARRGHTEHPPAEAYQRGPGYRGP